MKFLGMAFGRSHGTASPLTVEDARSGQNFDQALAYFKTAFPDSADYEDLSDQRDKGFIYLLKEGDKVVGMAAGIVYESSRTAQLTYLSADTADQKRQFFSQFTQSLFGKGIKGIFAELYKEGQESAEAPARDAADREFHLAQGMSFVKGEYDQPYNTPLPDVDGNDTNNDPDARISGLDLALLAAPGNISPEITAAAHVEALTRFYDPYLWHAQNQKLVAGYQSQVSPAYYRALKAMAGENFIPGPGMRL